MMDGHAAAADSSGDWTWIGHTKGLLAVRSSLMKVLSGLGLVVAMPGWRSSFADRAHGHVSV